MESNLPGRPAWATGPLNEFLNSIFPTYRTPMGVLDVQRLKNELSRSHEAIYKWLRRSRLSPDNATAICQLANRDDNRAALAAVGREPPSIGDFTVFLFA